MLVRRWLRTFQDLYLQVTSGRLTVNRREWNESCEAIAGTGKCWGTASGVQRLDGSKFVGGDGWGGS
jgi:hypothetical protein